MTRRETEILDVTTPSLDEFIYYLLLTEKRLNCLGPEEAEKPQIRRRFLIGSPLERIIAKAAKKCHIKQGYLQIAETEELIVKEEDGIFSLLHIVKGEGDISRFSAALDVLEFNQLWISAIKNGIEKDRYVLKYLEQGVTIFVDVYQGEKKGLVTAEVEYSSEEAARAFVLPRWLGSEVTYERRYSGKDLSVLGPPSSVEKLHLSEGSVVTETIPKADLEKVKEEIETRIKLREMKALGAGRQLEDLPPFLIFIGGPPGSGKTEQVIQYIKEVFPDQVSHVPLSLYPRERLTLEALRAQGIYANWDSPEFMRWGEIKAHLAMLLDGKSVEAPKYDVEKGEIDPFKPNTTIIKPNRIILVEGTHALDPMISGDEDLKIFVDISFPGSLLNMITHAADRAVKEKGMNPVQVIDNYFTDQEIGLEQYILQTRERADFILVNTLHPNMEAGQGGISECQYKFNLPHDFNLLHIQNLLGVKQIALNKVQSDYYFKSPNYEVDQKSMRIRVEDEKKVLSYKRAQKSAPEVSFAIDDKLEYDLFRSGESVITVHKKRTAYLVDKVTIIIDEVWTEDHEGNLLPKVGDFIEIKGSFGQNIEEHVRAIAIKLGFNPDQSIKSSYATIVESFIANRRLAS